MSPKRIALVLVAAISLTSCAWLQRKESTPISIQVGLALVEHDLAKSTPVILSDIPKKPIDIRQSIFAAQCLYNINDPPVPVIIGPIAVTLTGTFTTQSSTNFGWTTGPGGTLGFQVSTAKSQALGVPVTFVSAASLPNVYLGQQLDLLKGFDAKDPNKSRLLKEVVANRDLIQPIVDQAIADFPNPKSPCPRDLNQAISPALPLQ